MFPGVLGGPRFQEEMTLSHTILPLAQSATAPTASLLFLEPSGHTPLIQTVLSPGTNVSHSHISLMSSLKCHHLTEAFSGHSS